MLTFIDCDYNDEDDDDTDNGLACIPATADLIVMLEMTGASLLTVDGIAVPGALKA